MDSGIEQALKLYDNSPTKLAAAIGGGVRRQHIEHWLKAGVVPAARCPDVSAITGIPCDRLNNNVNWQAVVVSDSESLLASESAKEAGHA